MPPRVRGQRTEDRGQKRWGSVLCPLSSVLWLCALGAAPPQRPANGRDFWDLLYDRTTGRDVRQPTRPDALVRPGGVPYRRREPFTAVLRDDYAPGAAGQGRLPQPDSEAREIERLA